MIIKFKHFWCQSAVLQYCTIILAIIIIAGVVTTACASGQPASFAIEHADIIYAFMTILLSIVATLLTVVYINLRNSIKEIKDMSKGLYKKSDDHEHRLTAQEVICTTCRQSCPNAGYDSNRGR